MRQKIEKFANGIFSYEKPELLVSESELKLCATSGKETQAVFVVSNDHGTKVRGFCLSKSEFISFRNESFEEEENEVTVIFSAANLEAKTYISTTVEIITECGEYSMPVELEVTEAYIETSIGEASNLFHFANLAISSPEEAKNIFKTEDFKRVIIKNSPEYRNIYRNLSGAANTALVLEEFLIAAKKKSTMEFSIKASKLVYEAGDTSVVDKILISKNNWGYSQLRCEADGDFIELERTIIWTEDFENNEFWLKFAINPDKIRCGNNFGCIKISTLADEVEIPVLVYKNSPSSKSKRTNRKKRALRLSLIQNQLYYCLEMIDADTYTTEAERILDELKLYREEGDLEKLYRIYFDVLQDKKDEAVKAFEQIEGSVLESPDVKTYSLALYLASLIKSDSEKSDYINRLFRAYDNDHSVYSLLLYMRLDDRNRISRKQRFEELKNCYLNGETSVFGTIEGVRLLTSDPLLLKELSRFEIACLNEGLKFDLVNKLIGLQLSYVAVREKTSSRLLMDILKRFYEKYHQKELLEALCMQLVIKGTPSPEEYEWLEMGVNEQLRIKGLYELCLYSADVKAKLLPRPLLNYFASGYDMDPKLSAALYSNIIRFCDRNDNMFVMYRIQMETFAEKSLERGDFSPELAVIYEKMLRVENLSTRCIASLPYIMFKYEIETDWKKVANIAVSHKELNDPAFVKTLDGKAIADIFTENPVLVLMDNEGNRCVASFNTKTQKMVNRPDLMKLMMEKCMSDKRVMLNRLEAARYEGMNDEVVSLYTKCVEMEGLEEGFLLECRKSLIKYYYDNLEGELLENQLIRVDLKELEASERVFMMELMIFRELYNLALKNMEMFGFYGISPKRTSKLCSVLIRANSEQINSKLFMQLAMYSFENYRPDKMILAYLEKNYEGSTQELFDLWSSCHEEGIETIDLEERLIRTALFTENDMNFVKDVFEIYYGHCSSGKLVRAYLSYLAYGNLVCGNMLDSSMLDIMRREANYSENDICMLTLLKNYSTRKSFSSQEHSFIEYQIKKMENKGLLLPFFKDFPPEIRIPRQMRDKYYVEYHTDRHKKVTINYTMIDADGTENFKAEEMKDIGFGIFVKDFILFYGEVMQYYITEDGEERDAITESREVTLGPEHFGREECRYHHINLIITAKEMNDEKTVIKLIENYQFNDYAVKRLFEPFGG